MASKPFSFCSSGFSLMELLLVLAITGVLTATALPMMGRALGFHRLSGDARGAASAVALAKMRAAAVFGRVRVYVNVTGGDYHLEAWDAATSTWLADGGTRYLSTNVSFGYGAVGTAPPDTQGTIGQATACKNDLGTANIANTACIVFNSRGLPIDVTTAEPKVEALYVTDGTAVYGVTVAASGMIRGWRTLPVSTPAWELQ
jgi:prepilin-type N-terminal cleavage/methylation domain-containing protein